MTRADAIDAERGAHEATYAKLVNIADKLREERAAHETTKRELESQQRYSEEAAQAAQTHHDDLEKARADLSEAHRLYALGMASLRADVERLKRELAKAKLARRGGK